MSATQSLYYLERGSGPPLLLIHGLMVTGQMYEPVLDHLAARYRVIVPDLRGHGQSCSLPPPYTAEQMSVDLGELLDQVGVDTSLVLGYSQGGAVAQQFALDHRERCARLVLACTYAFNMSSLREWLEGHVAPLLVRGLGMERFAKFVFSAGVDGITPQRKEMLSNLIATQDRDSMILAWKAAMAFDSRRRLNEIHCPTLVLAGTQDTAVPLRHAQTLHNGISGSQLVLVDGGGHGLIWTHTEEFMRCVDAFLEAS